MFVSSLHTKCVDVANVTAQQLEIIVELSFQRGFSWDGRRRLARKKHFVWLKNLN